MSRRQSDFALNAVRSFIATMFWGPDEYLDAMTLVLAVTHVMDAFDAVPYVLVTSKDPKVGKSTLSKNIPFLLADRPWRVSANTTTDALRNKFLEREPPRAVLMDDASKFYGEAGTSRKTTPLYQMSIDGYEKNATVSVSRGGVTRDLPSYIMLFMNGLNNAVPEDLATRAVQFKLKAKPAHVQMRSALSTAAAKEAEPLKAELHRWANRNKKVMQEYVQAEVFRVHPLLTDRAMQLWGPLFAVAAAAGGSWRQRCLNAFLVMALDEGERPVVQRDEQALLDTAKVIQRHGVDRVFTAELLPELRRLPDDFYSEVDDKYLVEDLLPRALGPAREMRGKAMNGTVVMAVGRMSAPILEKAAALYDDLYPAPEPAGPDRVQRELTMTAVR
jgi:hypothetical protein